MTQPPIDVSFIIIEYHSVNDVLKCVNSLSKNCKGLNYEVIISSNSQYSSEKRNSLTGAYPEIIWSFNENNGGFAYGMNRGIEKSKGKYIILQNPDTSLLNDQLFQALEYFRSDNSIGILGPQILNDKGKIQDSCRPFITPMDIIKRFIKRKFRGDTAILESNLNYDEIQPVNWVIGAYMITSRKALGKVGLLNERYFMYVEDMDWCFRFWENGLRVIYYPKLKVNYEGDRKSTLGKLKFLPIKVNKYTYYHFKNYLSFYLGHGYLKIKKMQKIHFDSNIIKNK